jgi:hypothetical protein
MAALPNPRSTTSDPLDVTRRQLSIRTLNHRRPKDDTATRIRGEFIEMRGFSPTIEQAARLFDLPRDECDSILRNLVQQGFLQRSADGRYRLFAQPR